MNIDVTNPHDLSNNEISLWEMDVCIVLTDPTGGYTGSDAHLENIMTTFLANGWQVTIAVDDMGDSIIYGAGSGKPRVAVFNHIGVSEITGVVKRAVELQSAFCIITTDDFIPATSLSLTNMFLVVGYGGLFRYTDDLPYPRWKRILEDTNIASVGLNILRGVQKISSKMAKLRSVIPPYMRDDMYFETKESKDATKPPMYYMKRFQDVTNREIPPEHCMVHYSPEQWEKSASSIATIMHICAYKYDSIGLITDDSISQGISNELTSIQQLFSTTNNFWDKLTTLVVTHSGDTKLDLMRDARCMLYCNKCQVVINASRRIGHDVIREIFIPAVSPICDTISILPIGSIESSAYKGMISHNLKFHRSEAYMLNRDNLWIDLSTRAIVAPRIVNGMRTCCESGDIKDYFNRDIIASLPGLVKELMLERMKRYHGDGDEA